MDNYTRRKVSICIAILLHVIIFFIKIDSPIDSISHTNPVYSIEINTSTAINNPNHDANQVMGTNITENRHYDQLIKNIKKTTGGNTKIEGNDTQMEKKQVTNPETSRLDSRAMYDVENNQHKQTAAKLDMVGWEWDSLPNPDDNTEETGKIVFQIIIDSEGFVIGIKEIEKTVSPELLSIYKESIAKLTFSKSYDNVIDNTTTKGTVTFIINAK